MRLTNTMIRDYEETMFSIYEDGFSTTEEQDIEYQEWTGCINDMDDNLEYSFDGEFLVGSEWKDPYYDLEEVLVWKVREGQ